MIIKIIKIIILLLIITSLVAIEQIIPDCSRRELVTGLGLLHGTQTTPAVLLQANHTLYYCNCDRRRFLNKSTDYDKGYDSKTAIFLLLSINGIFGAQIKMFTTSKISRSKTIIPSLCLVISDEEMCDRGFRAQCHTSCLWKLMCLGASHKISGMVAADD